MLDTGKTTTVCGSEVEPGSRDRDRFLGPQMKEQTLGPVIGILFGLWKSSLCFTLA